MSLSQKPYWVFYYQYNVIYYNPGKTEVSHYTGPLASNIKSAAKNPGTRFGIKRISHLKLTQLLFFFIYKILEVNLQYQYNVILPRLWLVNHSVGPQILQKRAGEHTLASGEILNSLY